MERFILRFSGATEPSPGDIERIRSIANIRIIDSSPRMLLVEAPATALEGALSALPGWRLIREETVPLPDTRKKVSKSAP